MKNGVLGSCLKIAIMYSVPFKNENRKFQGPLHFLDMTCYSRYASLNSTTIQIFTYANLKNLAVKVLEIKYDAYEKYDLNFEPLGHFLGFHVYKYCGGTLIKFWTIIILVVPSIISYHIMYPMHT